MPATHTITGPTSLQQTLWLPRGTRIALALSVFTLLQQENLEARFNRRLRDSGSEICILAFIAALVGSILFDAARWEDFTAHDTRMITANLLVCLAAAALGKTLGFLYVRWQLARLIWAVAGRMEDMEDNASPLPFPSAPRGELFAMPSHSVPSLSRSTF
jgi:hypothetical protein